MTAVLFTHGVLCNYSCLVHGDSIERTNSDRASSGLPMFLTTHFTKIFISITFISIYCTLNYKNNK